MGKESKLQKRAGVSNTSINSDFLTEHGHRGEMVEVLYSLPLASLEERQRYVILWGFAQVAHLLIELPQTTLHDQIERSEDFYIFVERQAVEFRRRFTRPASATDCLVRYSVGEKLDAVFEIAKKLGGSPHALHQALDRALRTLANLLWVAPQDPLALLNFFELLVFVWNELRPSWGLGYDKAKEAAFLNEAVQRVTYTWDLEMPVLPFKS